MKEKSNKLGFFRFKKFSSRLVIRVFLTSFVCLIVPLVLYSLATTRVNYKQRSLGVYTALGNVTYEKIHLFMQVLDFQFASMDSVNQVILNKELPKGLDNQILLDFADEFFVNSVFFVRPINSGEGYELTNSSKGAVPELDFTQFIHEHGLDKVPRKFFIGKNLAGEKVLFLSQASFNEKTHAIEGILIFDIHFERLVSSIFYLREWENMGVSLLNNDNVIVASSDREYDGYNVTLASQFDPSMKGTIQLLPAHEYEDAYLYELNGVAYMAVVKPIPNSNMKLMTVVPKRVLYSPIQTLAEEILIMLLVILLVGGGTLYIFLRRLSKPLNQIQACFQQVAKGDLDAKYQPMKLGLEINDIGEAYNDTLDKLKTVMEEMKTAKVNEEVLAKELALGQEVQHSLLPTLMHKSSQLEAAGKFVSAKHVGGDCYDFFEEVDRDSHFFFISDTAGKGVMACLYALNIRSLIRAYSSSHEPIGNIVMKTNETFLADTGESGIFVTSWLGRFDHQTKHLSYVNVGHPPTLVKKANGRVDQLTTDGIAFGVISLDQVEVKEVALESGDILILYTDGVIEAQNSQGECYGMDRLLAFVRGISTDDPYEFSDLIHENVMKFSEGEEQFDDLTLLVIKVD